MDACDIVADALEIENAEQRLAYVDKACRSDRSLRDRVIAMLKFHAEDHTFLANTSFDHGVAFDQTGETIGSTIGRYKLLEQIGEGGFGTVYMAEQIEPVTRKVAFKIVKLGMDTRQVIARFDAEQQALAMLNHPNIAQVLDAGATQNGRPYFVMELVRGVAITEFCDKNRFSIRQRLELFLEVCKAVQYAHQKGIIHRDLKPSNIMVTVKGDEPTIKVIDFGVAKAIDQRLTTRTLFTHFNQLVGTPQYMSPEQADMSVYDVDTRSDVYSLGIILFELLTGETPVSAARLRESGLEEIRRIITDEDTPAPSSKVTSFGKQSPYLSSRSTSQFELEEQLRGELDWISTKCLSKEPDRRYSSAEALAADVQCHLDCEPVSAGPPGVIYRWQKFFKKRRSLVYAVGTTTASFLLGFAFTIVSLLNSVEARHAAELAKKSAIEEQAQSETLVGLLDTLISMSDPDTGRNADYRVNELLDDFTHKLPDLSDQPQVEILLRQMLGRAYGNLGLNEQSWEQMRRAVELQKREGLELEAAKSLCQMASVSLDAGRFPRNVTRANANAREAIRICMKENEDSDVILRAYGLLAFAQIFQSEYLPAERTLQAAEKVAKRGNSPKKSQDLDIPRAWLHLMQGRVDEAIDLVNTADPNGDRHQGLKARCLSAQGKHDEAERILRDTLKKTRKSFGAYTFHERRIIKNIADEMRFQNRHEGAAEFLQENRDGMTHTALAWLLPDWAIVHLDLGEYEQVDEYCRELARRVSADGEELNTRVVALLMRLTIADATNLGDTADIATSARPEMQEAHTRWPDDFGMDLMLAWTLAHSQPDDAGQRARAMSLAKESVSAIQKAGLGLGKDYRASFPYHVMAQVLAADRDFKSAADYQIQALEKLPADHLFLRGYYEERLADHLTNDDRVDEAEALLRAAINDRDANDVKPKLQFHRANVRLKLVELLIAGHEKDRAEARQILDEAVQIFGRSPNRLSQERAGRLVKRLAGDR